MIALDETFVAREGIGPRRSRHRRTAVIVSAMVLLAACGGNGGGENARTFEADGPIVYVAMGNSLTFQPSGLGQNLKYRKLLVEDFGVDVELRDHTVGGERSDEMLERIRTNPTLRADLAEADVITVLIPNDEVLEPMMTATGFEGRDPSECGGADNLQCVRDTLDAYAATTEAIFADLVGLADPDTVLIRAMDTYLLYAPTLNEHGWRDMIQPYWEQGNRDVVAAAAGYGIPTAAVYDAFMGADGDLDPVAAALVQADEIHPTEAGAELIAELVHSLGYGLPG